jgi:hypothetical protein
MGGNDEEKKDRRRGDEQGGGTGKEQYKNVLRLVQNVEMKKETKRELMKCHEDRPGVGLR